MTTPNPHETPTFDFDLPLERRGTGSYKWDPAPEGVIPLWVADMDFRTAPSVIEALHARVEHGVFGYERVPAEWYDALRGWFRRRHHWDFPREWVLNTTGVVPAISAVIKAFTTPGDGVALLTPVYNCFYSSIRNNACRAVEIPLVNAPEGWRIDFEALEEALLPEDVKVLLFCSPHNPVGRVWTKEELETVATIARRTGVMLVSDEIHGEFIFSEHPYIPMGKVRSADLRRTVVFTSPTKTFNLAGAGIAAIIAADPDVRAKVDRALNVNECCDVNVFGVSADVAAWNAGAPWLDALLKYLRGNIDAARSLLETELPGAGISPLEGTYLMWVDLRSALPKGLTVERLAVRLKREHGVWVAAGTDYGAAGEGFVRINLASRRELLLEGLRRFAWGVRAVANETQ